MPDIPSRSVPVAQRTAFVMHVETCDTCRRHLGRTILERGQPCANALTMVQVALEVLVGASAIALRVFGHALA